MLIEMHRIALLLTSQSQKPDMLIGGQYFGKISGQDDGWLEDEHPSRGRLVCDILFNVRELPAAGQI